MSTAETIDVMLAAAGLNPSPEERTGMLELYATFKPGVDAMYALPECKYEVPALVFQADPTLAEW